MKTISIETKQSRFILFYLFQIEKLKKEFDKLFNYGTNKSTSKEDFLKHTSEGLNKWEEEKNRVLQEQQISVLIPRYLYIWPSRELLLVFCISKGVGLLIYGPRYPPHSYFSTLFNSQLGILSFRAQILLFNFFYTSFHFFLLSLFCIHITHKCQLYTFSYHICYFSYLFFFIQIKRCQVLFTWHRS